jgi:hypothetical protein
MSFIVRIFFAGLIAFVPSRDGKELIVLLPDAAEASVASDGTAVGPHQALLLARAAGCTGDCGVADAGIAALLFADQTPSKAGEALSDALQQGTVWRLDGSELSFAAAAGVARFAPPLSIRRNLRPTARGQARLLPATPDEGKDFSWVADLGRIVPGAGVVDPAVLAPIPPAKRIAARLRLDSGEVSTYRLVRVDGQVPPLRFRSLAAKGAEVAYTQALADWVVAEFWVSGGALEVVERRFADGARRSIALTPSCGVVEIAVLNVARAHPGAHAGGGEPLALPEPGRHFEKYYELAQVRPPFRPVPYVADQAVGLPVHQEHGSALLDALRLDDPRGVYDRLICPLAQFSDGGSR